MRILKEGDRGRAVCPTCEGLQQTRHEYRPVRLERTGVDVPDVLVGVCTTCGETVTIPAQSAPRLKEARERRRRPFKARIPRHLDDTLRLLADRFDAPFSGFCPALIRFYLHELGRSRRFARRVHRLADSHLTSGRSDAELSVRLDDDLLSTAWAQAQRVGLDTKTAMIKGLIVAAAEDVIRDRAPARRRALEKVAACA